MLLLSKMLSSSLLLFLLLSLSLCERGKFSGLPWPGIETLSATLFYCSYAVSPKMQSCVSNASVLILSLAATPLEGSQPPHPPVPLCPPTFQSSTCFSVPLCPPPMKALAWGTPAHPHSTRRSTVNAEDRAWFHQGPPCCDELKGHWVLSPDYPLESPGEYF